MGKNFTKEETAIFFLLFLGGQPVIIFVLCIVHPMGFRAYGKERLREIFLHCCVSKARLFVLIQNLYIYMNLRFHVCFIQSFFLYYLLKFSVYPESIVIFTGARNPLTYEDETLYALSKLDMDDSYGDKHQISKNRIFFSH